jgi:hypothetical protein
MGEKKFLRKCSYVKNVSTFGMSQRSGKLKTTTMKGQIFVNTIGERHEVVRLSKRGNKVTAKNLSDNEEYVFYFDVPSMKFIKAYTSDVELGILQIN